MSAAIDEYLKRVRENLGRDPRAEEVLEELRSHVEDLRGALIEEGRSPDEAITLALQRMGEARKLGISLAHARTRSLDRATLGMLAAVWAIGFSGLFGSEVSDLHLLWTVLGLLAAAGAFRLRAAAVIRAWPWIYVASFALIAACWLGGVRYQGQPYLDLGSIKLRCLEAAPFFLLLSGAGVLDWMSRSPSSRASLGWVALGLPVPVLAGLHAWAGAVFYSFGVCFAAAARGRPFWERCFFSAGALGILGLAAFDLELVRLGESGIAVQDLRSDFLPGVLLTSWAFALLTVASLVALGRMAFFARNVADPAARSMVLSLLTALFAQLAWSILANLGWAPLPATGLAFPLVGYGGTLLVTELALLGYCLGLTRRGALPV